MGSPVELAERDEGGRGEYAPPLFGLRASGRSKVAIESSQVRFTKTEVTSQGNARPKVNINYRLIGYREGTDNRYKPCRNAS